MVKKLFSHDERTKLSIAEGNCLKLYAKMNVRNFILRCYGTEDRPIDDVPFTTLCFFNIKTNKCHVDVGLYSNQRSQNTSKCGKNNSSYRILKSSVIATETTHGSMGCIC